MFSATTFLVTDEQEFQQGELQLYTVRVCKVCLARIPGKCKKSTTLMSGDGTQIWIVRRRTGSRQDWVAYLLLWLKPLVDGNDRWSSAFLESKDGFFYESDGSHDELDGKCLVATVNWFMNSRWWPFSFSSRNKPQNFEHSAKTYRLNKPCHTFNFTVTMWIDVSVANWSMRVEKEGLLWE